MKHVKACFSGSEDRESSFHHSGSPVRLVQDLLCAGKILQRHFILPGDDVKQMQAILSAMENQESSFHYYGRPVSLVQACLCRGKIWSGRFIHREGAVKHV